MLFAVFDFVSIVAVGYENTYTYKYNQGNTKTKRVPGKSKICSAFSESMQSMLVLILAKSKNRVCSFFLLLKYSRWNSEEFHSLLKFKGVLFYVGAPARAPIRTISVRDKIR